MGSVVKILGTSLTGATSVTFNGTPAVSKVISGSLISTTVPAGTTNGKIRVVTPGGTLSSNGPFRVRPRRAHFAPKSPSGPCPDLHRAVQLRQHGRLPFPIGGPSHQMGARTDVRWRGQQTRALPALVVGRSSEPSRVAGERITTFNGRVIRCTRSKPASDWTSARRMNRLGVWS
ncbi:MAG TPA: IPT/TIG domain-containing protein [Terriglobia bacterium]